MKSYGQYCGLARSLDVVGDRWSLLIVRQLLIGPARYRDLAAGLPGIASNLLTTRLRDLEAAGVVRREVVGEGSSVAYALTPWGAGLREPIEAFIRWSTPLMVDGPAGDRVDPAWLRLALPALLRPRVRPRRSVRVVISTEGVEVGLRAGRDGVDLDPDAGGAADATVRASMHLVLGLASGELTLEEARALGDVEIEGDEAAARTVLGA